MNDYSCRHSRESGKPEARGHILSGNTWTFWVIVVISSLLSACATAGVIAAKAAWFAVETGVRVGAATVHGATRVVGIETQHAVDLTADAATRVWAQKESGKVAGKFWTYAQKGAYATCYDFLSDELKKRWSKREFARETQKWAGKIKGVDLLEPIVYPDHVEIPANIRSQDGAESLVRMYLSPINAAWKILTWSIQ